MSIQHAAKPTPVTEAQPTQWAPFVGRWSARQTPVELFTNQTKQVRGTFADTENLDQQIFNSLVRLKVDCSFIAMHLSAEDRAKIFKELDFILSPDDWDEEDKLPEAASFSNFLKWTIYANNKAWDSLGFSNEGNTLAAWVRDNLVLTASFNCINKVYWSWRKTSTEGDVSFANGQSTLVEFARQSDFLLGT